MRAIFVVPAYNEVENVPRLLADLESRPALWTNGGQVLLVDDGSADGTADAAQRYDGPLPVEVLRQIPNQGPGRAFDRGFRRALELAGEGDLVVTLEADTTSDLDALSVMMFRASVGADVVLASVHAGGQLIGVGRRRRFLSQAASYAIRHGAGLDARTVSSFFRVYRADALRSAYARFGDSFIREDGFACKAEILMKLTALGMDVGEVPVDLDASRRIGESKLRVLPTVGGYTRVMARHVATRLKVPT